VINWRDIRNPDAGGAEVYLHSLCSEFVRFGHRVDFFTSIFPGAKKEELIDGVNIFRVGGKLSVYVQIFLLYQKRMRDFDVVLESINTIPFFVRLYARKPVVAVLYSINNGRALLRELGITPISIFGLSLNLVMAKLYRKSTVITISDTSRKELFSAGFDPSKVFVAKPSLGCEFEKIVGQVSCDERRINRVIYVGRLKKYKGIDVLIQAVGILKETLPVELIIVGKGDYEHKLREIVHSLGLEGNVKFMGFLDEIEKIRLLKTASVFVCCSIDEGGWTIAGLEAMRCGLPLVVTQSQKDLVKEGVTGFVALDSAGPDVIAKKICAVLEGNWKEMSHQSTDFSLTISAKESAKIALSALFSSRK